MARKDKVQEAIKQEVSEIIRDDLNDPRIGFVTITRVEVSQDLRHAKIFISEFGKPVGDRSTFEALAHAKSFIRRQLAQRLRMRFVPEIMFKEDKSSEYSIYIAQKIDELKTELPKD